MDSIKDFVSPKRFSISSYVCVILHSICGVILIAITTALKLGDMENFNCPVETTFATHKTSVEKTCFSNYNDVYNSPVRLFGFVLLSFIPVAVVSVIYSLAVGSRIDETERYLCGRNSPLFSGSNQPGTRTLYVFYFYFFHLVARSIFGMLFINLQFTALYPNSFDSEFICIYPKLKQPDLNITTAKNASVPLSSVTCKNLAAQDKQFWSHAVFWCNLFFTLIMLLEVIYMITGFTKTGRFPYFKPKSWSCDLEFIMKYFLRKQHMLEGIMLDDIDTPTPTPTPSSHQFWKEKVLKAPLTCINYGLDTYSNLDEIFIDFVIQSEKPPLTIHLEKIEHVFYSNKDAKGKFPRTILALGRPGIGKTFLTRKIMRDWAMGIDGFYHGKITFYFKFRWFHFEQLKNVTLKKLLQLSTELNEDEFESVFAEIWANPQSSIFIFDGLDEFDGNLDKFQNYLDQSKMSPDDTTSPMSAMALFMKILSGQILPEATVLVTSRPTANDLLSKLNFEQKFEICGFTEDEIENYVEQFCANHGKKALKPKLWNHIKSSELKNLCYIPGNCYIVCVTLLNYLDGQGNANALPSTQTELKKAVITKKNKGHEKVLKDLDSWLSMV